MGKILDYEEMLEHLENLDSHVIIKQKPIGLTEFGYEIPHYTYGIGKEHVILTAGTHATELIGNCFLIELMEALAQKKLKWDPKKYTIHFLPIVNPEGTIIVTSAIRRWIPRNSSRELETLKAKEFYQALKKDDEKGTMDSYELFSGITPEILSKEHQSLKENLMKLEKMYHYPKGYMIYWSSNGNGIDLNSNIEPTKYLEDTLHHVKRYGKLHYQHLCVTVPGPYGCPTRLSEFHLEKENQALFQFYQKMYKNHRVIGSIIYHACGGLVIYKNTKESPWGISSLNKDQTLAEIYAKYAGYQCSCNQSMTTVDAYLKSKYPGILLVELTPVRGTPLAQFMGNQPDFYQETINKNIAALFATVNKMSEVYQKNVKNMYRK